MNVTRATFPAVADDLCEYLRTCDFYALDLEMTGIALPGAPESPTLTVAESYRTKSEVAARYSILQLGICTFHVAEGRGITARPFNVSLFPSGSVSSSGRDGERDIALSPGTLAFLRRHNMDFQRWVYEGVGYCTAEGKALLENAHNESEADALRRSLLSHDVHAAAAHLSADDRQWVVSSAQRVEAFNEDKAGAAELSLSSASRAAQERLKGLVSHRFPLLRASLRGRPPKRFMHLARMTEEEAARHRAEEERKAKAAVVDAVGFRRVFEAMVACRKPIVGHHCFVDLLFLSATFDVCPTLLGLAEYKQRLKAQFPVIFDTKYISTVENHFPPGTFAQTHLEGLYEHVKALHPPMPITLPLGFQAYDPRALRDTKKAHEAAFDALMTGHVFLCLARAMKLLRWEDGDGGRDGEWLTRAAAEVGNRVSVFRSLYALRTDRDEDEYLPQGPVVRIEHASLSVAEVEGALVKVGYTPQQLLEVDPTSILAILPAGEASAVTAQVNSAFGGPPHAMKASPLAPPHTQSVAITADDTELAEALRGLSWSSVPGGVAAAGISAAKVKALLSKALLRIR